MLIMLTAAIMVFPNCSARYGDAIATLSAGGPDSIRYVRFEGVADCLRVGLSSGETQLWNVKRKHLQSRGIAGREVRAYCFAGPGLVYTLHADGSVALRSADTGVQISCLVAGNRKVTYIASDQFGRYLAMVMDDQVHLIGAKRVKVLKVSGVRVASFSREGSTIGLSRSDGEVQLYDISTLKRISGVRVARRGAPLFALSTTASLIAAREGWADALVGIWSVKAGKKVIAMSDSRSAETMLWAPADNRLLIGFTWGLAQLYKAKTGTVEAVFKGEQRGSQYPVRAIDISTDGKLIAIGYWEGIVAVYRAPT